MSEESENVRVVLSRIEATLEGQNKAMDLFSGSVLKRLDHHSARISALETWRNVVLGAGSVISVVGALVWERLKSKVP